MTSSDSPDRTKKFGQSIVAAFFVVSSVLGAAAIVVGFLLLFYNENRVNPVLRSGIATPIDAYDSRPWGVNGQLVAVSGVPDEREMVGDGMFLAPGPYLEVRREVEVYSWYETHETREVPDRYPPGALGAMPGQMMNMGAPRDFYQYELRWTPNPHDSLGFSVPEGHQNPDIHVEKGTYRPDKITMGNYSVETKNLLMPLGQELDLSDEILDIENERFREKQGTRVGNYVYLDGADPDQPEVGDVRILYKVVPAGEQVTVFGTLRDSRIEPYGGKGTGAYRLEAGGIDPSAFEASRRFMASLWVARAFSFLAVLLGILFVTMAPLAKRRSLVLVLAAMVMAAAVTSAFGVAVRMYNGLPMVAVGALLTWAAALLLGRSQMRSS